MPQVAYSRSSKLTGAHASVITCLCLSPNGLFLAVGSLEGKVSVWSTKTGRLFFVVEGPVPALSLVWKPSSEYEFFIGQSNGNLVHVHIRQVRNNRLETTGGCNEVHVWRVDEHLTISPLSQLHKSPAIKLDAQRPVLISGLHWIKGSHSSNVLVVCYVYHGAMIWDPITNKMLRYLPLNTMIGGISITPDSKFIAISNMTEGFDIWDLDAGKHMASYSHRCEHTLRVPVKFVQKGQTLLGGSTVGRPCVWDVETEVLTQDLRHEKGIVLAIDMIVCRTFNSGRGVT
ncbi:WD40 repeat-like protein [Coniophora puteana RWD-64-598 SS2]|uniref:WD40 repeat-like protein n=1 Tax=Coniophora puteana (strain RWD-64-598) TaxID=741705 RepID=A0A5M3MG90_CONPW|nr:WD40 repeat-like protein [Coniophora puteana RWD-64-598 SS2]EIW77774.1 WD40 repeat-like protein [Coniophora puteana RWD-64-598 SS2]